MSYCHNYLSDSIALLKQWNFCSSLKLHFKLLCGLVGVKNAIQFQPWGAEGALVEWPPKSRGLIHLCRITAFRVQSLSAQVSTTLCSYDDSK